MALAYLYFSLGLSGIVFGGVLHARVSHVWTRVCEALSTSIEDGARTGSGPGLDRASRGRMWAGSWMCASLFLELEQHVI